jgi:pimeloyl-ACP methyl ester carboxylesterase
MPQVPGVEHRELDVAGLRIHVAEAGEGDPLLLLHGWPQHWYEWRHVIPPLAERFRVICPDLPGFGWSQAPAEPARYEKERLADDMLALLDALELERVRMAGHDWGGWIGFLMAIRAPERLERYMALNIVHPWVHTRQFAPHAWRFWYQLVLANPLGATTVRRTDFVARTTRLSLADRSAMTDEEIEAFAAPLREPAQARASMLLYRTFLLRELPALARGRYRGKRLGVPTKILFGERDAALSPKLLEGVEKRGGDVSVELVPDCGHFIVDEQPQLVADRALSFFSQSREPTTTAAA